MISFLFIFCKKNNTNNGEIMKKIVIILVLLCILFIINKKETIISVFNSDDQYDIYYLDFRDSNLNTDNFLDYFDNINIDVLKIEPYINPLYKDKFNLDEYLFNYSGKGNNIKKFKDKYLEELKQINYSDYTSCIINGIKINMVKVFTTKEEIKKIIKNNKNVKYVFNYTDYASI